jgi:hypothetical protein
MAVYQTTRHGYRRRHATRSKHNPKKNGSAEMLSELKYQRSAPYKTSNVPNRPKWLAPILMPNGTERLKL